MTGCCLDYIGSTDKPTWRSAVCGCMPIALTVLLVDWCQFCFGLYCFFRPERFPSTYLEYLYGIRINPRHLLYFGVYILGFLAALGLFSQRASIALARAAYYIQSVKFFLIMLIMFLLPIWIILVAFYARGDEVYLAIVGTIIFVLITGLEFWELQLHRSLYQILEAGGSGWEFKTADEVAFDRQAEAVQEAQETYATPLLGTPLYV